MESYSIWEKQIKSLSVDPSLHSMEKNYLYSYVDNKTYSGLERIDNNQYYNNTAAVAAHQ